MKEKVDQYTKMTETPVAKLLVNLSIPTIISMLVTNIYNLVDTAFVGTLGTSQSGAVGIVFGYMAILQAIAFMFGQGCGSILSRKLGAKDQEGASNVASTGFFCCFGLCLIVSVISALFLDEICLFLGSTDTILPYSRTYISYILIAAPFMGSSLTLNNILRYEGRAVLGMIGLGLGAILNICGDAIFMFGLDMGIAGAGLSTALSQLVSFFILVSMFVRKKTQCRLQLRRISMGYMLLNVMLTGFPSLLRQGLNSLATVILNSQAKVYGDEAIAAMSIVSRVMFFVFSIALGIGQGFQPISAFNFGAKRYDRVRKGYRLAILMGESVVLVLGTIVVLNATPIILLFRNDAEVARIGSRALILQCLAQATMPYCMVTEMLFQSTGKRLGATVMSAIRSGLFFIPSILILSHYRGLAGIQEAQPLSFVLSIIPTVIFGRYFWRNINSIKAVK